MGAFLAALVVITMLAGCTVIPVGHHHQVGTLEIGADLPLSGDDAGDGVPVRDAILLAISSAGSVCGASAHQDSCVAIQPRFMDDVSKGIHDPARGASNVQQLAADSRVIGMIGPLYDGVARSELPLANAARLAMISPTNTDVCLTQEPADGHCQGLSARLRPHGQNNYFRVVASEIVEGEAAAELAYKKLGKRHAFVVSDPSWLGQRLASGFSVRFVTDGGRLVTDEATADVVYFPGSDLAAIAAARRQMVASTPGIVLIGPDAMASDQFARLAGASTRGSYYTLVGPYPPATSPAAGFRRAYRSRFGREASSSALTAFDATGALIAAVSRAIDDASGALPSRGQVLSEVARTSDDAGAMGRFGFDGHGDTTLRWVSAFEWLAPTDLTGTFTAQFAIN